MIGFIAPFKILDHIERLNIVKETSREYHCICPVCGDGGFKIDKKDGKYQGFKCNCDLKEIREAIRPWSEVKESQQNLNQPNKKTKNRKSNPQIRLAKLDSSACEAPVPEQKPIPAWLVKQGIPPEAKETRYWYSKTQWVSRFEWLTPEGKEKTIRQGHVKSNGLIQWAKGSKGWCAYKLREAVQNCTDKWVLGVEGEGCVESARVIALSAITWQGSNWDKKNISSDLIKLKESGAKGLVYFPDHDETGKKKAELVESACALLKFPSLVLDPTEVWVDMPEKGDITDWAEAYSQTSTNELVSRLERAIALAAERQEQERQKEEEEKKLKSLPSWSQSDIAKYLAEKYQGKLAWNTDLQEWYCYSLITRGIWSQGSPERIGKLVKSEIDSIAYEIGRASKKKPTYTIGFVKGVIELLKLDLEVDRWDEAEGLLPMLNGVLDLETRNLLPHSPENRLTWSLPYEYNPLATCQPIQEWLLTMCNGDRDLVQLMRAYLLGVVTGRTDWQKYLELVGSGGTGKSTFTRLATALVGSKNVHTTTLKKLEKSKFETASIAGKRLVSINDSERYAGDVTKLKNLTGQDSLPYEVKHKQSRGGFTPSALVIVTTNETIQSCDYTSGLARRRITVPMMNQITGDRQKNLIEHKNGKMYGEFLEYIPGLLNWVLEMDEDESTSIVKNYESAVPSLLAMKARTLIETNPIADWLDNFVVYDKQTKTRIGVAKREKDSNSEHWYLNTEEWLYANYAEYCHDSGTNSVSLRRFVNLLDDLSNNQLGLDIKRERDRSGSYFVGLKIRTKFDTSPPIITGNTLVVTNTKPKVSSINVINRLWTMVMVKVTDVMEYVMAESIGSDECDGCDGKNENSSKLENTPKSRTECNTQCEGQKEKKVISEEFLKMPSHPSHPSQESAQSHIGQAVMDNRDAITVGDKVEIDDCPGHWNWASPFTVSAIEGKLVKLEMVDGLVEIEKLSVVNG